MAWTEIHATDDDLIQTSRWEDERGWFYKVEVAQEGMMKAERTVFVEDPLHSGKNVKFAWRKHSDTVWSARVWGGELHRSGVGEKFEMKFITAGEEAAKKRAQLKKD